MRDGSFTPGDLEQLAERGISEREARRHLELLHDPPPPARLVRAATPGDGITRIGGEDVADLPADALVERFEETRLAGGVWQFVPASGAATRMFRELAAEAPDALARFAAHVEAFPFHAELTRAADAADTTSPPAPSHRHRVLLDELGYGERAKGLIPFHLYGDEGRTPFEEHLVEGARYGRDDGGRARLHFTVAPDQEPAFAELLADASERLHQALDTRYTVTFSHQSPATDTLAAEPEGGPFRQDDGTLLLRPGGHGALLANLSELAAKEKPELVLIKNIDNVVPDRAKDPVVTARKTLGGLLLTLRDRVFGILERLRTSDDAPVDDGFLADAYGFAARWFGHQPPADASARRRALLDALDRPLRVCGVVRNTGEPGGGPFWVEDRESGRVSLQIVESGQVSDDQRDIFASGTHFNPVDLACSVLGPDGVPYDLDRFVDPSTVFIAAKTHQGRPLRALERPGLWNGAMARWNTVFLEVPPETFAPVKTVFDLLRPEHQP